MIYSRNARAAYKISLNRLVASPSAAGVDAKATPEPTEQSHRGRRDDPCFDPMFFIIISPARTFYEWRARGMRRCGNVKFDDFLASARECSPHSFQSPSAPPRSPATPPRSETRNCTTHIFIFARIIIC